MVYARMHSKRWGLKSLPYFSEFESEQAMRDYATEYNMVIDWFEFETVTPSM